MVTVDHRPGLRGEDRQDLPGRGPGGRRSLRSRPIRIATLLFFRMVLRIMFTQGVFKLLLYHVYMYVCVLNMCMYVYICIAGINTILRDFNEITFKTTLFGSPDEQ